MKYNGFNGAVSVVVTMLAGSLLSGCAWSIGGRKDGETFERPTQGQELIDLKRARDQGALSDAEYEDQRLKILTR
jgi:hypothetical protein